jgi:bidirectional [NiFe] hydrogenase diaphorase subunit
MSGRPQERRVASEPVGGERVDLVMDGRTLAARPGETVLAVARRAGIEIPTLCDHPDLEPVGACRLCLVEITHADWQGWRGLVTACLYPVSEGLEVDTRSERVHQARRRVMSLLAARCPGAPVIQELARRHGVERERLSISADGDDCILCGLCVRVCETYATSAITTLNRGDTKAVGSPADRPPDDCVGCGACAVVCPTGTIAAGRTATGYEIWQRSFATSVAEIDGDHCIGCGACEEACPFHVARVTLAPDGRRVAIIPVEHCRGCGACVGACPSGAIDQRDHAWADLQERLRAPGEPAVVPAALAATAIPSPPAGPSAPARLAVLACHRSNLGAAELPARVELFEFPCTGRASVPLLLSGLAAGCGGVLVLGRHAATCRLGGAEDPARERAVQAAALAELGGLDPDRVRFVTPPAGPQGPLEAVRRFAEEVGGGHVGTDEGDDPASDRTVAPAAGVHTCTQPARVDTSTQRFESEGLDTTLELVSRLSERSDSRVPDLRGWLEAAALPEARPQGPALVAGLLPVLSYAAAALCRPVVWEQIAGQALAQLAHLGLSGAGIWTGGIDPGQMLVALSAADREALRADGLESLLLDDLLREKGAGLGRPKTPVTVACDGSADQPALIEALGHRPVDVGPDPLGPTFRMTPADRERAEARLAVADRAGAVALYCAEPARGPGARPGSGRRSGCS